MLNSKLIPRKKSSHPLPSSDLQRKSSLTLIPSSKTKKQESNPLKKPKEQKKLTHSTSKTKLTRKPKPQKTDENFNSLNHKKSLEKLQYASKPSKETKTKRISEEFTYERRQEKQKILLTEHTLTKTISEAKLNSKKANKKKTEFKQTQEQKEQQKQKTHTKTLQRNPTSKKTLGIKSKLKHPSTGSIHTQSQQNQRKSSKQKIKLKNKISEIIQKSILYSEVNYEFKEQISLLGSGIKREEEFFIPYPFLSSQSEYQGGREGQERRRLEHKAAVTIQRHFRGYIQRKYIEEARWIIESIKKIQRFWRRCLSKKREAKRQEMLKTQQIVRGESSISLITIKDFNETGRMEKRMMGEQVCEVEEEQRIESSGREKETLNEIIKKLLREENLNESIKEKIRSAMMGEENGKKGEGQLSQTNQSKQCSHINRSNHSTHASHPSKSNPKGLTLKTVDQQQSSKISQEKSRQSYVKQKINMQINSQRCFNSPMNVSNSSNGLLMTSPVVKKAASPKCLSSYGKESGSYSKEVKGNYNNYFKSTNKNAVFSSPNKGEQNSNNTNTDRKAIRSHSGNKRDKDKQNLTDVLNRQVKENKEFKQNKQSKDINSKNSIALQIARDINQIQFDFGRDSIEDQKPLCIKQNNFQNSTNNDKQKQVKQEYLFHAQISSNSPIFKCDQISADQINLLSSQKIQLSTRRAPRPSKLKPFPTEFYIIEEFCLLITDYLREDQFKTQTFMQKVNNMKYFKLEKILQQWQNWEYEEFASENQPFRNYLLKHRYDRPSIFSNPEKSMLIEYPDIRLFLNNNDYSDEDIFIDSSPQSSYIRFMFDAFEECMYQNFRQISVNNLHLASFKEAQHGMGYLNIVFSETMGNMLRSAEMLCGSFQVENMTECEKEERKIMNEMREREMIKEFVDEPIDTSVCQIWSKLLAGKQVFDQLIDEIAEEIMKITLKREKTKGYSMN